MDVQGGDCGCCCQIWCALPNFSTREKEAGYYQQLSYYGAGVLWFATLVQVDKPLELAAKAELVAPIFHYLMVESHFFSGARTMSLSLLLHLWLLQGRPEVPAAANVRRTIAAHKDAWKVLDLLKQSVDHPGHEPHLAEPHTVVQASFVGLLGLLTAPKPARAPQSSYLETLCHLLGEISDPMCWAQTRDRVFDLFENGTLTEDILLAHAYPGFLRAFGREVARCGYDTSSPPSQAGPDFQKEELLYAMLAFLAAAFGKALTEQARAQGSSPDPEWATGGPSLNPQTLPRLAHVIVSTRAAEPLAALSASPFYPRSNMVCSAAAEAASKNARVFPAFLDQMVPAIVLKMYEDSDAQRARCFERGTVLRHIACGLRPADKPLGFGVVAPTAGKRSAKYLYDMNFAAVSADVIAGKEHVAGEVFKEIDEDSYEARKARVEADMLKTNWLPKEATCGVCGLEFEALKRCSRCKGVGYCGAVCQRKDWPSHKKVCKQHA